MSQLYRRKLRLGFVQALQGIGAEVQSPGDWDAASASLPVIKVRLGPETKASLTRTMPEFTTNASIELQVAVAGDTGEAAQDALEALVAQIEDRVLGSPAVVALVQQIASVTSVPSYASQGERHLAGMAMTFDCESFEQYDPIDIDPALATPLVGLDVVVDSVNVFDPTGTYPAPPFPDAVQPAPRTSGPDGRAEGGLTIDLPQ